MINFIKNKRAETNISITISVYLLIITFVIIINIIPIFHRQQNLDYFAKTILRQAEMDGTVEQDECYDYLCSVLNFKPNITWEWDKYNGTKKVQLNTKILVTLEDEYEFDVGGIFKKISIPLKSQASGKSEVYWK